MRQICDRVEGGAAAHRLRDVARVRPILGDQESDELSTRLDRTIVISIHNIEVMKADLPNWELAASSMSHILLLACPLAYPKLHSALADPTSSTCPIMSVSG
jgi:hypothetical protein